MQTQKTSPWLIAFRVIFTVALLWCIAYIFRKSKIKQRIDQLILCFHYIVLLVFVSAKIAKSKSITIKLVCICYAKPNPILLITEVGRITIKLA